MKLIFIAFCKSHSAFSCVCVCVTGISIALTAFLCRCRCRCHCRCHCHCLSSAALATLLRAGALFDERDKLTLMLVCSYTQCYVCVYVHVYVCQAGVLLLLLLLYFRWLQIIFYARLRKCSRRAACLAQTCRAH